ALSPRRPHAAGAGSYLQEDRMCHTKVFGEREVCFSRHALQRAVELGVQPERLAKIITRPSEAWPSGKPGGAICLSDRKCTVILKPCSGHWAAATVLPANEKEWRRAERQG